jgi:hypothetical protein
MSKPAYSKANVQFHRDGLYGPSKPAINVKLYKIDLRTLTLPLEEGVVDGAATYTEDDFTHDWIDANVEEDEMETVWHGVCEQGWESLEQEAKDIWGKETKVFAEGRSGGWAIVEGLKDFEDWNAVDLAQWRRFEQYAKAVLSDIPRSMLMDIYLNYYLPPEVTV